MRHFLKYGFAVALIVLMSAPSYSQPGRRGGGNSPLDIVVRSQTAQKFINATSSQVDQAKKESEKLSAERRKLFDRNSNLSREERRKKFEELRTKGDKAVETIFKGEQGKKLKQLVLNLQGIRGITSAADELLLSDDQISKIREVQKNSFGEMRKIFQEARGDREKMQKLFAEYRKKTEAKVLGVLNDLQKDKWKEMVGNVPDEVINKVREETRRRRRRPDI